jgi:hypothetical protein
MKTGRRYLGAKWYGITYGLLCMVMAGCAPVPENVASTPQCSSPVVAGLAAGPTTTPEQRKAVLLKRLTDRSMVTTADEEAALTVRQVAFLYAAREMGVGDDPVAQVMAGVQDSLIRIPGIVQKVNHIEEMMALGHARNQARRNVSGAHLSTMLVADSVDYYAVVDGVNNAIADTTVEWSSVISTVASIASGAHSSFPTDTAFIAWVDAAAGDASDWRNLVERATVWEWADNGMTGPEYSISSNGCVVIHSNGNTVAWPAWVKKVVRDVNLVLGAVVATGSRTIAVSSELVGAAIDGIYLAGMMAMAEEIGGMMQEGGHKALAAACASHSASVAFYLDNCQ